MVVTSMNRRVLAVFLVFLAVVVIAVTVVFAVQSLQGQKQPTVSATPTDTKTGHRHRKGTPVGDGSPTPFSSPVATGMPYVQGTQIIDGSGHPLLLRGAQIETPFNYINLWDSGKKPSVELNSTVFGQMRSWKMNVLRLPLSNWIYAKDPTNYLSQLDQAVQLANQAGLYVILDLHDDGKAGSPYADNADLPKTEDISFWEAIAGHYKSNPMVMFDVYNEPKAIGWNTWLRGGGTQAGATVVGMYDLVRAIRSVGANQIIIVEPGSAGQGSGGGGLNGAEEGGWGTIANNTIPDPNIVYSLHVYDYIAEPAAQQDAKWGPILNHYPIIYGEWALLPNGFDQAGIDHCKAIVHSQADQDATNFLNYMASRNANWVAWEFAPQRLVTDYTTFTPTTLDNPWTCGDSSSSAGMGSLVKQF